MPQVFSKKGFTLIELLVVIVVIGILASLATVGMKSARSKASDSKKVSEVRSLSTALEMYMMDEGKYPADIQTMWGQPLVGPTSGKTYMTLPKQLSGNAYGNYCRGNDSIYIYNWINAGTSYTLSYCLDNPMNGCPPGPKTARPNLVMDCDNQVSACLPSCTNNDGTHRSCGDNGCGGSCGGCGGSLVCKEDTGTCVACVGDGDCTGTNQHCIDNNCLPCRTGVTADCSLCQTCNASNTCDDVPVDTVEGRCTTTGCGTGKCTADQICGFNNNFETCTGGFCIADGSCCTPETCASKGYTCGTFNSTNCPGVVVPSCGTCAVGSCTNNQCCTPNSIVVTCGNRCTGTATNNCGQVINCSTNTCSGATPVCDSSGTGTCVGCTSDANCSACQSCNTTTKTCGNKTDGSTDARCTAGQVCYSGACCSPSTNTCASLGQCSGTVIKGCGLNPETCNNNCSGGAPICDTGGTNRCVQCLNNTHCASLTCMKCSAATKTCVPQSSSEDINNQCTPSACYTGNCSGSSASCGYFTSGSRGYCPSCQQCTGGPSCSSCTVCCKSDGSGNCGSLDHDIGGLVWGYSGINNSYCSGTAILSAKDGDDSNCWWNQDCSYFFPGSYRKITGNCMQFNRTTACPTSQYNSFRLIRCYRCD